MLAAIAEQTPPDPTLLSRLASRLDTIAQTLNRRPTPEPLPAPPASIPDTTPLITQQLLRLDRQVSVLERATADIATLP
jgi:hypothetical protein